MAMRKVFLMIGFALMAMCANAQLEFSKFKFTKDSPFGAAPTRKALDVKFKNTSDKTIKKFTVFYSGVNQINEAICSDIYGGVNANAKHTKYRSLMFTGPYEPGKTNKSWTSGVFFYNQKVTAFPQKVVITYMDNSEEIIEITKDNIDKYFPCLEWMDVDYVGGFQPAN